MRMPPATGAVHSAEIEYALGNLATNKDVCLDKLWRSPELMQQYFANFVSSATRTERGCPPGPRSTAAIRRVMILDIESRAVPEKHRERYQFLEGLYELSHSAAHSKAVQHVTLQAVVARDAIG